MREDCKEGRCDWTGCEGKRLEVSFLRHFLVVEDCEGSVEKVSDQTPNPSCIARTNLYALYRNVCGQSPPLSVNVHLFL